MKKASEYRQHAQECRDLAKGVLEGDERRHLLDLAATWDKLAWERSELVRRHPELGLRGEHDEEVADGEEAGRTVRGGERLEHSRD